MQIIRPWIRYITPAVLILGQAALIFREILVEKKLYDIEKL